MKKMFYRNFKSIVAIVCIITMCSCEKEESYHKEEKAITKTVTLNDLPFIKKSIDAEKSLQSNKDSGINYLDAIIGDGILQITENGTNSYTFALSIEEPENQLTNLLIVEEADSFQYYLVIYHSTDMSTWKEDLSAHRLPSVEATIEIRSLSDNKQRYAVYTSGCSVNETSFTCPSGMHSDNNSFDCIYERSSWSFKITKMSVPCFREEGGGGGGGGSTSPNSPANILANFVSGLSTAQKAWWYNVQNAGAVSVIKNYLNSNAYMESSKNFSRWAIDYFRLHPNTTVAQFQNWFMAPSEGKDGDYDSAFWENPNLSFQHQNLPSWNDFNAAYPRNLDGTYMTGADNVYSHVGGAVWQARLDYPISTANTCALKVSIALNYSGIIIPALYNGNGTKQTIQGSDGKYYFLNAKALNAWMRKTFGTFPENPNHSRFISTDGGVNGENFPTLLAGMKGIYSMVAKQEIQATWGTGHADILENSNCAAGCHFYDNINLLVPVDYIDIWILE